MNTADSLDEAKALAIARAGFASRDMDIGTASADPQGPTLFAAPEGQLGLQFKPEKGPVEMFVVERVARPSANGNPTP